MSQPTRWHGVLSRVSALADTLRLPGGSLKLRVLMVSVAVLAASVLLSCYLLVNLLCARAEEAVAGLERASVQRQADQLGSRVDAARQALKAAADGLDWMAAPSVRQAWGFVQTRQVLMSLFSAVFVVSPDGQVLIVRDAQGVHEVSFGVADRPYFQQTVAQRRSVLSEPIINRLSNTPIVVLTWPIYAADGTLAGVVCGALGLPDLALEVQNTELHATSYTIVADRQGRILSHRDVARRMQTIDTEPHMARSAQHWRMQRNRATQPAETLMETDTMVSMADVPGVDWTVFRVAAIDTLLGQPQRARMQALVLAVAFALGGGLLIVAVLGRLLRPLRQLEQRAHALLDGSLPADEGWPAARGEIGELSRVLQHVMRERAQAERYSFDLLQKMHSVMAAAPIGIAFVRDRHFELVSHEYAALLGCEPQDLVGDTAFRYYVNADDYHALARRVSQAFGAGQVFSDEFRFVRKDGSVFWGRNQGRPVDANHPHLGTIWLLADVSGEREARERLTWSATHDALTRLLNRSGFEQALADRLDTRVSTGPAALLYLDLDRFKQINDSAGHAAGDAVLERVAQVLSHCVRATDVVGRLGGDEFAILLTGCDRALALRIAEQIRLGIEEAHVAWMGQRLSVGVSIGVVGLDEEPTDVASVLASADAACYDAKHAGRNVVREGRGAHRLRLVGGGSGE